MSASPLLQVSSNDEAVEQQLLSESQASASKHQQPSSKATIPSARLLNAARVDKIRVASNPPSAPSSGMAVPKRGQGKLKRPTLLFREDMAKHPRRNLARRGDVFELDIESPEKRGGAPFKLTQTVNRSKPLKRERKGTKASTRTVQTDEVTLPWLPPSGQPQQAMINEDPIIAHTEALRLSSPALTLEDRTVQGAEEDSTGASHPKASKTKMSRVNTAIVKRKVDDPVMSQERMAKSPQQESLELHEQPRIKPQSKRSHPRVVIPVKAVSQPAREASAPPLRGDDQAQDKLSQPEANSRQIHRERGRGKPQKATTDSSSRQTQTNELGAASEVPPAENELSTTNQNGGRQVPKSRVGVQESANVEPDLNNNDTDQLEPEETDPNGVQTPLEKITAYTMLEKRPGKCQTAAAARVKHTCRAETLLLDQPKTELREVTESVRSIQALLLAFGADNTEERKRLQVDAYGYLFRALAIYLVSLYDWLDDNRESLDAISIKVELAEAIIAFKEEIASWKVRIPTRYKNDHFIRDVDRELISPLRRVVEMNRVALSHAEASVHARKMQEEVQLKMKEKEEERSRKEKNVSIQRERWKRWQDLHIWRQQCEPDPLRRRHLYIDPSYYTAHFNSFNERDANGTEFERIPLFKERDSAPRRVPSATQDEWTDEQVAALIEGLTKLAGKCWAHMMVHLFVDPIQVKMSFERYSSSIAGPGAFCEILRFRSLHHKLRLYVLFC
jgi:hypothetical protein